MSKSRDNETRNRYRAHTIAERMFTNGTGQIADRLVLTAKDGKDLGGWCFGAFVDHVAEALDELDAARETSPEAGSTPRPASKRKPPPAPPAPPRPTKRP